MTVLRHAFALYAVRELSRFTSAFAREREGSSLDAGLRSIREACLATLGMEFDTLTRFDAKSVVGLFAAPEQARVLARLVDERARLMVQHGQLAAGLDDSVYAGQLLACSRQRFGVPRDTRAAELMQREVGEPSVLV
ncbi:hypothetical protein [Hyalangium versicolor]|uniref:hypothetical protein n=1 Tax=Hyalangium versicolor TaxID=2861190 RepID=UPI001CC9CE3C|nr:hypothetical protein [Hyalangium versicolor]